MMGGNGILGEGEKNEEGKDEEGRELYMVGGKLGVVEIFSERSVLTFPPTVLYSNYKKSQIIINSAQNKI